VKVQQRNYFAVGDEIEIFGPNKDNLHHKITKLQDEFGNDLLVAPHPLQVVYFQLPFPVSAGDMIRRLNND
jgi:putative protease